MLFTRPRVWAGLVLLCSAALRPLVAQCPDGAPPPCRAKVNNSVAVLYFDNLSRDTADAFLAAGLTEEITAHLGQVGKLSVASRTAVRQLRNASALGPSELGQALNVSYLVNGSIRRSALRFRITVELLRASNGRQVWSGQFDRDQADHIAMQEDVAVAVSNAVAGELLPSERSKLRRLAALLPFVGPGAKKPTKSPVAFEYWERATNALWDNTPLALERALSGFQTALRIDSAFTAARGRLALTYAWATNWHWVLPGVEPVDQVPRGLEEAGRAIEADSLSSDALAARGLLLFFSDPPDYTQALTALRHSVAHDSTNAVAHFAHGFVLRRVGRNAESEQEFRRVLQIQPDHRQALTELGLLSQAGGRYADARAWYDSALAVDSAAWLPRTLRARARIGAGDLAGAKSDAATAASQAPEAAASFAMATSVLVDVARGDSAGARAHVVQMSRNQRDASGAYSVPDGCEGALALTAIGAREEPLDMLARVRPRGASLWSCLTMPWFDPLRADPRFARIVDDAKPAIAGRR